MLNQICSIVSHVPLEPGALVRHLCLATKTWTEKNLRVFRGWSSLHSISRPWLTSGALQKANRSTRVSLASRVLGNGVAPRFLWQHVEQDRDEKAADRGQLALDLLKFPALASAQCSQAALEACQA